VNLQGIALDHRPAFVQGLLPYLQEHRARMGRPHWIVVDEAHQLLPTTWDPASLTLPQELRGMLLITEHPESVARPVLESVDTVLAVGESPDATLTAFARAAGLPPPLRTGTALEKGEVLVWRRAGGDPIRVRSAPPLGEQRRHSRKYTEGNL
jgi:hypothetical protein